MLDTLRSGKKADSKVTGLAHHISSLGGTSEGGEPDLNTCGEDNG